MTHELGLLLVDRDGTTSLAWPREDVSVMALVNESELGSLERVHDLSGWTASWRQALRDDCAEPDRAASSLVLIDVPARRLVWSEYGLQPRITNHLLEQAWPGWHAVFSPEGFGGVVACVPAAVGRLSSSGVATEVPDAPRLDVPPPRQALRECPGFGPEGDPAPGSPLSVTLETGRTMLWRSRVGFETLAALGPEAVVGFARRAWARRAHGDGWGRDWMYVEAGATPDPVRWGAHLDGRTRTLTWWTFDSLDPETPAFEEYWEGWRIVCDGDRFENHEARAGGWALQQPWERQVAAARVDLAELTDAPATEPLDLPRPLPAARYVDREGVVHEAVATAPAPQRPASPPERADLARNLAAPLDSVRAWLPVAEDLRWTAAAGTGTSRFFGKLGGPLGWCGRRFDDGRRRSVLGDIAGFRTVRGMEAIRKDTPTRIPQRATELGDGGSLAVGLTVEQQGRVTVEMVRDTDEALVSDAPQGITTLFLAPDAVPEPWRRTAERHPRPVAESASAQAVADAVRRRLRFAEPAARERVAAAGDELGVALTDEVVALYTTAGSGRMDLAAVPRTCCSSSEETTFTILPLDHPHREDLRRGEAPAPRDLEAWRAVVPRDRYRRVQALARCPLWFPIGLGEDGQTFAVDLAPDIEGSYGQIIDITPAWGSRPGAEWVAGSLAELLTGRVVTAAHHHGCPRLLETDHAGRRGVHVVVETGSRSGLDAVEAWTERLRITGPARHGEPWDLGELEGHPHLRVVEIAGARAVGLDVLSRLPALEYLSLDLGAWNRLLDSGEAPGGLRAAGLSSAGAGSSDLNAYVVRGVSMLSRGVATANRILAAYDREPQTLVRLAGRLPEDE